MRRDLWLFVSKPSGFQERLREILDDVADDDRFRNPGLIHDRAMNLAVDSFCDKDVAILRSWVETVLVCTDSDRTDESAVFMAVMLLANTRSSMVSDDGLREIISTIRMRWIERTDLVANALHRSMSDVAKCKWQRDRLANENAWPFGEESLEVLVGSVCDHNCFVELVCEVRPKLTENQVAVLAELQPRVLKELRRHREKVVTLTQLMEKHRSFLDLIPDGQG